MEGGVSGVDWSKARRMDGREGFTVRQLEQLGQKRSIVSAQVGKRRIESPKFGWLRNLL